MAKRSTSFHNERTVDYEHFRRIKHLHTKLTSIRVAKPKKRARRAAHSGRQHEELPPEYAEQRERGW